MISFDSIGRCTSVRGFFFVSHLVGVVYEAGSKKCKKHTEYEREQFLGTIVHEKEPYTHATRYTEK